MVKEEILAMSGRKLDIQVEEQIMGGCGHILHRYAKDKRREHLEHPDYPTYRCRKCKKEFRGLIAREDAIICRKYSTDILAANDVLEKLKERWDCIELIWDVGAWDICLENYTTGKEFCLGKEAGETYEKLPVAICKAALLSKLEEGVTNE